MTLSLRLHVLSCRCLSCRHTWTHSRPVLCNEETGFQSTQPAGELRFSLPLTSLYHTQQEWPVCFRCAASARAKPVPPEPGQAPLTQAPLTPIDHAERVLQSLLRR